MADIRFFFTHNGRVVQLPYNPEKIEVSKPGNNETTEIIGLGEINLLKDRKLKEFSVESFFPRFDTAYGVLTSGDFEEPEFYVDFFNSVYEAKEPMQFTVSGTHIDEMVSIENFSWYLVAQDEDTHYVLGLKEYKEHKPLVQAKADSNTKAQSASTTTRSNTSGKITIGSDVIVNGQLHVDSYGAGLGKTLKSYKGKISSIKDGRTCPYHVTTPSGDWLGWVASAAVKLA